MELAAVLLVTMGGLRVLIVDDYDPDRRFTAIMLERSGAFGSVRGVASADAALAICRELAGGTAEPVKVPDAQKLAAKLAQSRA